MLEDQDLQKIGKLITDSEKRIVDNVIIQVGELLETNLLPDIHGLKEDMRVVKVDVNGIKEATETLADKESINRMMDQTLTRDERLQEKSHLIADTLGQKRTFNLAEVQAIRQIQVFTKESA